MKGKHFNANVLLTALFGIKKEPQTTAEETRYTSLLQTLTTNKRRECRRAEQPTYRSVTALIH